MISIVYIYNIYIHIYLLLIIYLLVYLFAIYLFIYLFVYMVNGVVNTHIHRWASQPDPGEPTCRTIWRSCRGISRARLAAGNFLEAIFHRRFNSKQKIRHT